jgi:hypothetical protein
MKKLIALMMVLCLLCAAAAAAAETTTTEEGLVFPNGVKFGMSPEEVAAAEGAPGKKDVEHTHGGITFDELEYEKVIESHFNNAKVDKHYLFIDGKLVGLCIELKSRDYSYEELKASFAAIAEFAALDYAALGNGIYVLDDEGEPEHNAVAFVKDDVMVVIEPDDDGEDLDLTFVDLTADFIKK